MTSPDSADYWLLSAEIHGSPGSDDGMSSVEASTLQPLENRLLPNYPNPFNPATNIVYDVSRSGHVEVSIHNIQGKEVACLANQ